MAADPKAVQELFAQAIAINDLAERDQFLIDQCATNAELHARVVKLIAAYRDGEGLLESPTKAFAATMLHSRTGPQPGNVIAGRYKLLESIGEGGMGTVWVAEQTQPVRRKVALKLVKPGMDSKQVLARFDAERQALALMDHPNIAKVFDGGVTEQGRPFFSMEYVMGMPLTDYCDQTRLPVEERLRLFVPICQAVQHAHQKGIIHRDLKPSNVLICLYDGKPVPKVIDFGLAKAMYQPLTEQTVHTGHGLMIGTPLYMSPEQAEHNNLDVDTRTDIYSLGVMLYELLTGSTPLEKAQFKDAAFGEILRLIKEVEPPKPSTRVSSSANLPKIAAQRNLDSKQLGRSIRGDLDWIVMKAIEKERGRRYDTANGLARDIERFLNLEAVEACPPSTSYRLRRLARKHRAVLGTVAAFALLLVLGTGLSIWQALRATKAESLASQRLVEVQSEQHKTQEALEATKQSERRAMEMESQATSKSKDLQALTEDQRRIIYASEMNQVRLEAQRGNLARMREILLEQVPIDGNEDLRGFEWNYWYRYINQAKVVSKFDKATVDSRGSALVRVLPGGRQVAWTQGKNTELVDLDSSTLRRLPLQLRHYVDRTPISDNGRILVGACLSHTYPVGSYKPPGSDQGSSTSCSVVEPSGLIHTFDYPKDAFKHISAMNISSSGNLICVIGYDATHSPKTPATRICVWSVDSKELVLNEVYHREINRISFSPDVRRLAAYLCHGTKRHVDVFREVGVIIDLATGKELATLENDDDIDSLFWIPGSDRVLLSTLGFSGASRKQLMAWRTSDASARPVLMSGDAMPDYVNGTVSPDGSMLAITSHTVQQIRLFDPNRGDLIDTLQTDGKGIVSMTYSDDGRQLVATTTQGELLRWDLGKDRDLFGLRTNPLPRLARNGYTLSQDQALLCVTIIDGTLIVRTRDGSETKLKLGFPNATVATALARISDDNKLLAVVTNLGPDGKALARGKGMLEVYDLVDKKRLWQSGQIPIRNEMPIFGSTLEFSADGQKLVHLSSVCNVYHARSGKGTAIDPRKNNTTPASQMMRLQKNAQTGSLIFAFPEMMADRTPRTVVVDPTNGNELYVSTDDLSLQLIGIAPDGQHCISIQPTGLQVWNIATGERLLSFPGLFGVFSLDGKRIAIVTPKPKTTVLTFSSVALWDLASRQKICELPLAGDAIDEVRFSPDGKRLLTMEGKTLSSHSTIPRGRLWDVETGREILDMRIADMNHYDWELVFDNSGQQLTQLLFNKSSATSAGGKTVFYDARPLEPSVDNKLAADRLITQLSNRFALKKEWIVEIESLAGLKKGIRDAALAKADEVVISSDQVAKLTGEIVGQRNRSRQDYERALRWAEELHRMEPNALRSRVLLGAAYHRLNRYEDALRTLLPEETAETVPSSEAASIDDNLRRVVLALVQYQMGNKKDAVSSLQVLNKVAVPETYYASLAYEAAFLIRPPNRIRPTAPESMPKEDELVKRVQGFIAIFGNPDIELSKLPGGVGYRLVNYDTNLDQRLAQEEVLVVFRDLYRLGEPIAKAKADLHSYVEGNLQFLEEAIRDAPHYMTARFVRAWIRATCIDPQFRDPEKALDEAKSLCEQTKYQDATFLEGLAAAYAASSDFASAIRWQTEAARIHRDNGAASSRHRFDEAQGRLKAYEKNQVCDPKLPLTNDLIVNVSSPTNRERDISVPYLSPQVVLQSKRIAGNGAAWSPDDTRIVRSIKSASSRRPLEWIDLSSGKTQLVCEDGFYPVWTSVPNERIYFTRTPDGAAPKSVPIVNPSNLSIWYCEPDGKNLTRWMAGTAPALLKDGTLIVKTTTTRNQGNFKTLFKGFQLDANGALNETELQHDVEGPYGELSPDGKLAAVSTGNLVIQEIASNKVIHTVNLDLLGLGSSTVGAWSPDSRFYVYLARSETKAGLWVIDVRTGKTRLLADLDTLKLAWSHNGQYLAVSERFKNEIVILDVSSLYRESDLSNALQQ